jgi:hypothetical protein
MKLLYFKKVHATYMYSSLFCSQRFCSGCTVHPELSRAVLSWPPCPSCGAVFYSWLSYQGCVDDTIPTQSRYSCLVLILLFSLSCHSCPIIALIFLAFLSQLCWLAYYGSAVWSWLYGLFYGFLQPWSCRLYCHG